MSNVSIFDELRAVDQLDALHDYNGVGKEWRASEQRADLVKHEKIQLDKNRRFNKSKFRTRSARWRAGSKSSKPKHFW